MEENFDFSVTKTYSLTPRHILMLKQVAKRTERSEADLLREGIEDLDRKYPPVEQPAGVVGDGAALEG